MTKIKTVGVIGAGQMGSGIAHVCALGGYDVLLNDVAGERLEKALELIATNMGRQVAKGVIEQKAMDAAIKRITPISTPQGLKDVDLVIEAATENEAVKKEIFAAIIPHLRPDALLASNTSSISITRLAAATDRPGNSG